MYRVVCVVFAIVAAGCGGERNEEATATAASDDEHAEGSSPSPGDEREPASAPSEPVERSCDEHAAPADDAVRAVLDANAACEFDVDCVAAPLEVSCLSPCEVAVHPRGLPALREAAAAAAAHCPAFEAAGCSVAIDCLESTPRCDAGRCAMGEGDAPLREMPVPAENAASRSDDPPPRPAPGDAEDEHGRRLFAAIVADDPALAADFFFPREAFAKVKAIADPDGYWKRLYRRYARDIHEIHESLGDVPGAQYGRLEIIRRGGWVPIGEEGNALPYWVARHNTLHYTVDGEARSFEVRVMITWGERWYITHLNEFH